MLSIINKCIKDFLSKKKIKCVNSYVLPTDDSDVFKLIFSSWTHNGLEFFKKNNASFMKDLRLELKNTCDINIYYSSNIISLFENELSTYITVTYLINFPDEVRYKIMMNLSEKDMQSLWEVDVKYLDVLSNQLFCKDKFFHDNTIFTHLKFTKIIINWCELKTEISKLLKLSSVEFEIRPDIHNMELAITNNCINYFKLLYEDKNIPIFSELVEFKFPFTISSLNFEIFEMLYNDERIKQLYHLPRQVYVFAGQLGSPSSVERLMVDKRTTKKDIRLMITYSIIGNNMNVFYMLLSVLDDLSYDGGSLLRLAYHYKRIDILNIIIKDYRFKATNDSMRIIRSMSRNNSQKPSGDIQILSFLNLYRLWNIILDLF